MARTLAWLVLIGALAALLITATLMVPAGQPISTVQLESGVVVDPPRPLEPFELVDHLAQPFDNARLKGGWSVAMIGFTHCPDICPTALGQLAVLKQRLLKRDAELEVLFVSVDPQRDTSEVLAGYIDFFGDELIAASGEKEQLRRFADSLGFAWVKVPLGNDRYTVDHSGALALIDPRGRLAGYFLPPLDLAAMEEDLGRVLTATRDQH